MRLRDHSLTIVLMLAFAASIVGMIFTGAAVFNHELAEHGQAPVSTLAYLSSGVFISALFDDRELYGEEDGCLFLEAGFGKLADQHRTFQDQGEAGRWLISQLA